MSEEPKKKMAIWKILVVVGVMAVGVYVVGESLRQTSDHALPQAPVEQTVVDRILSERRSEQGRPLATSLAPTMQPQPGVGTRSLKVYYSRRAYAGAPPVIPHEVDAEIARTMNCSVCHAGGGYVSQFNAYAPVTPHPQYTNCMQCHVPSNTNTLFVASRWQSTRPPQVHRPALPGSPPPIPHTLQLRENCLACHAGPAAVVEVRTTHPERVNCRQCHVPRTTGETFDRTAFVRSK